MMLLEPSHWALRSDAGGGVGGGVMQYKASENYRINESLIRTKNWFAYGDNVLKDRESKLSSVDT